MGGTCWAPARVTRDAPVLSVVALAAVASVVLAVAIHLVLPERVQGLSTDEVVPILLAVAALCVIGLTGDRRPAIAWSASVVAMLIATVDIAASLRTAATDPAFAAGSDGRRWLAMLLCLVALSASTAALGFALTARDRFGRWLTVIGGAALLWSIGVSLWGLANPDARGFVDARTGEASALGSLSLVTRSTLVVVVGFLVLGVLADTRAPAARAQRRAAMALPTPTSTRERLAYSGVWLRAFWDEISPGQARAHRAALSERSRIARDLHADVVPAVRRALAEAERDGSAERLAASLREVLAEVDGLVASEHAIVLEVGGIVAAIEALAERIEDGSDVRVAINIVEADHIPDVGDMTDARTEPPIEVAAAAVRVATLALENVVRHAPGATAVVTMHAGADRMDLAIEDDGPGLSTGARQAAVASGRRGLADMAVEAAGCGASIDLGPRVDGGAGTRVAFSWPSD
jgi:signal transduction histidine kinase